MTSPTHSRQLNIPTRTQVFRLQMKPPSTHSTPAYTQCPKRAPPRIHLNTQVKANTSSPRAVCIIMVPFPVITMKCCAASQAGFYEKCHRGKWPLCESVWRRIDRSTIGGTPTWTRPSRIASRAAFPRPKMFLACRGSLPTKLSIPPHRQQNGGHTGLFLGHSPAMVAQLMASTELAEHIRCPLVPSRLVSPAQGRPSAKRSSTTRHFRQEAPIQQTRNKH